MSRFHLTNDEPALLGIDKLHFSRYLNVIEKRVIQRSERSPFVVGIYGSWGCGKTSLMKMIAKILQKDEYRDQWEIVEFSPWMYRNEKTLLLPLLATIAKQRTSFQKLIQSIVDSGPSLIKSLSTVSPVAKAGIPLITFLDELKKKKDKAKDFGEKVADAVKEVTGENKRMVFFIDDLDRCHDHKQIIGLLEQIKLFLHLENCLFFIGADKDQIVKAIERQFPGEGRNYLDKFIQLPFELSPHHGHHLMDMVGIEDDELRRYLMLISEVLNHNPRMLKKLWNQAVIGLEVLKEEVNRVNRSNESPSIMLMLKWLLLLECEPLKTNPYLYLKFEKIADRGEKIQLEELYNDLCLKNSDGKWLSDFHRRLALFICQDMHRHRYYSPTKLSLYAKASGEDVSRSRTMIESSMFAGKTRLTHEDFADSDLSYGVFTGFVFEECIFTNAILREAALKSVTFVRCDLEGACFDHAETDNLIFQECLNLDKLNTEPIRYEIIADAVIASLTMHNDNTGEEQLYKMYRTIIERHRELGTLTQEIENQLREKGKKVRERIEVNYNSIGINEINSVGADDVQ